MKCNKFLSLDIIFAYLDTSLTHSTEGLSNLTCMMDVCLRAFSSYLHPFLDGESVFSHMIMHSVYDVMLLMHKLSVQNWGSEDETVHWLTSINWLYLSICVDIVSTCCSCPGTGRGRVTVYTYQSLEVYLFYFLLNITNHNKTQVYITVITATIPDVLN